MKIVFRERVLYYASVFLRDFYIMKNVFRKSFLYYEKRFL